MKRLLLLAALLVGSAASALALEPSHATMETLRQRILGGATGVVEGRIYMEGHKPSAPHEPLVGVGVLIVPRSVELLQHLDTVKRQSRESIDGFRDAVPATRTAVDEYETALWRLGYPDVAIRTVTDATGAFRAEVPAGQWVMFATRSVFVAIRSKPADGSSSVAAFDPLARYSTPQYQHFLQVAKLTGFDAVSVWLRELDVEARHTVALELHDRGVWLSGVAEETEMPRRLRTGGGGRKR